MSRTFDDLDPAAKEWIEFLHRASGGKISVPGLNDDQVPTEAAAQSRPTGYDPSQGRGGFTPDNTPIDEDDIRARFGDYFANQGARTRETRAIQRSIDELGI